MDNNDYGRSEPGYGAPRQAQQTSERADGAPTAWEKSVLNKVLMASIQEQRSARRWKIFFRFFWTLLFLGYIFVVFFASSGVRSEETKSHVAVIEIKGVIAEGEMSSAKWINEALGSAFKNDASKAIILRINSPGGSPVQAEMIYDEIFRLRAKYGNKPVYAAIEDTGASAAYYIAASADQIYVGRSSIVGSIGVLSDQFGFTGLMEKLGVERRLMTSGKSKGVLDPFSPLKPEDKAFFEGMLHQVHQTFINDVKKGRGDRLVIDDQIFSGLFWTGEESIKRGLADGLGTVDSIARDVVGVTRIVNYTKERNPFEMFAREFGAGVGDVAIEAIRSSELELR
ncbi:MAG: S49 family peptidase [Saezia sp.]